MPTWDGSPRLSTVMIDLFGCDPAGGLAAWAPDYLFIGAIQRAYTPGDKMDEFPVLIGLEGLAKAPSPAQCCRRSTSTIGTPMA